MFKRMFIMIVLVLAVAAGLGFLWYKNLQKSIAGMMKMMPPPTAVSTVTVQPDVWEPVLHAVGTLRAINGVTVSTDMAGIVSEITFESGSQVKKGDVLVKMDTTQEEAQIRAAEAKRDLAKTDIERKRDLLTKKAIAASDFDAAESELRQTTASVEEMKAMTARKKITAPFDGVIGIRQVNLGQYLNPGAMIAPLQSLDPIYVEFAVPQQSLAQVQLGKKIRVNAEGWEKPVEGEVTAVDAKVDESTRNIIVQGTLKNPDHKLRPGMYVNVEVLLPQQEKVLAIPSSAISFAPYGDSVFVVHPGKPPVETGAPPTPAGMKEFYVEQIFVKLGQTRGDRVEVTSGLKAGDEIVTAGVFRLRPNAPVNVTNSVKPGNELNPKPADT